MTLVRPWRAVGKTRYQSGIQTAQELFALASRREDHQILDFEGVLNPFIHPPVAQNTQLNSSD
ncbi:hypothetical protein [Nostoc sp. ChiQUE01b]|uniref:hypothetical protein n=1 Tax=Nostoc sp. ChiQUE01b TaxID=3075376 RepID=UPI002AD4DBEB|nr:hypothetical protein [Nostoc sp. ChiQUE01b]MDZ8263621.1 hypothetical protein [Nostoc sp. ChiQUE01b]